MPIPQPSRPPVLPPFFPPYYPPVTYESRPQPGSGNPADPTNNPSAPKSQPDQGVPSREGDESATCVYYPVPGFTDTEGQSVDLEISFGHFPAWKGMPAGKLMLYAVGTHTSLADGTLLQFDHISQRRIGVVIPSTSDNPIGTNKVALITQTGQIRYYDFTNGPVGSPFGGSEIHTERLRLLNSDYSLCYGNVEDATFFEETFADGSIIQYRADDGTPCSYCTYQGTWVQEEELGGDLRVVRQTLDGQCAYYDNKLDSMHHANNIQQDRIRQIWCRMDGLLDCPDASTIHWYAPADTFAMLDGNGRFPIRTGATPLKTWNLAALEDTEAPADKTNSRRLSLFKVRVTGRDTNEESRWRPYGTDGTYFIRGSGQQAACSVKTRRALESGNPITRPNGLVLQAGQTPASAIRETTYNFKGERPLDGINLDTAGFVDSIVREDYRSYPFGDVIVKRSKSYGPGNEQIWTYTYETDGTSRNYGRMIRQTAPEGNWTEYDYDDEGRVVRERTLWDDAISVLETRTTFADLWFNDYRTSCVEKWIIAPDGQETRLLRTDSLYEETDLLIRETVTETALGAEHPRISVTETHGDSAECPFARGRLKKTIARDGTETVYGYTATEEEGAQWRETSTRVHQGTVIPGQSTRSVIFHDESGYAFIHREQVHDGTEFVTVSETRSSADETGRTISTQNSGDATETTDWSCCGPLHEVHADGTRSWYEYDSAKRLIRETHEAPAPLPEILEHISLTRQPNTIITHEYDGLGRETSTVTTIGSCSSRTEKSYDRRGNPASTTGADGLVTHYAYSDDNLEETVTSPAGKVSISRKNAAGVLVEESATGQRTLCYHRRISPSGIIETTRLDTPDGPIAGQRITDGFGRAASSAIPSGDRSDELVEEQIRYDANGRTISRTREGMARELMEYDAFGNMTRQITKLSCSAEADPATDRITEFSTRYTRLASPPSWLPADMASGVYRQRESSVLLPNGVHIGEENYTRITEREKTSVSLSKNKYGRWQGSITREEAGNTVTTIRQDGIATPSLQYGIGGETVLAIDPAGNMAGSIRRYTEAGSSVARTDARGNTVTSSYDKAGRIVSIQDAGGHATAYSYDSVTGLLECTTDAMGGEIRYRYDASEQVTEQFGTGTQPIRKGYDGSGRMVSLTTWRNPEETLTSVPAAGGDTTRWTFDSVTGLMTEKTYADGSSETTVYDRYRRPVQTIRADDSTIRHTYQSLTGELKETAYGDRSPSVLRTYDVLGRPVTATDATGVRTYSYDNLGDLVREQFDGPLPSVLEYKRDGCGRDAGYALRVGGETIQDTSLAYDEYGRLASASPEAGKVFSYRYGPGNLLSGMSWPNGMSREIRYEDRRNVVSSLVYKDAGGGELLAHRYASDALQRPSLLTDCQNAVERQRIVPHYNARSELTAAQYDGTRNYTYDYDNIGNRIHSCEQAHAHDYAGNRLNQYDGIRDSSTGDTFAPEFDIHGNQTRIRTGTGTWDVLYNMENRPVLFASGRHSVACTYDLMGRRIERREYQGNTLTSHEHFIYKGYTQIAAYRLDVEGQPSGGRIHDKSYYWDPAQPAATRLLSMKDAADGTTLYAACDKMKNMTSLYDDAGACRARYAYSPYGEKLIREGDKSQANPFGFSCEYEDRSLGLYYYNYRYYNCLDGRWISRDPIGEQDHWNLYIATGNQVFNKVDSLGLWTRMKGRGQEHNWCAGKGDTLKNLASKYGANEEDWQCLWPVGETPNHGYPDIIEPGDQYDASNLNENRQDNEIQFILSHDLVQDFSQVFPKATLINPQFIPSQLKLISKEGNTPISSFVSAGHGGYGGYLEKNGPWKQYSVQEILDIGRSSTFARARQKKGPVRCWFTRKAKARFAGYTSQTIAEAFAESILRKGATSYGTDRTVGAGVRGIIWKKPKMFYGYVDLGVNDDGSPKYNWLSYSDYFTSPVWKTFEGKL